MFEAFLIWDAIWSLWGWIGKGWGRVSGMEAAFNQAVPALSMSFCPGICGIPAQRSVLFALPMCFFKRPIFGHSHKPWRLCSEQVSTSWLKEVERSSLGQTYLQCPLTGVFFFCLIWMKAIIRRNAAQVSLASSQCLITFLCVNSTCLWLDVTSLEATGLLPHLM